MSLNFLPALQAPTLLAKPVLHAISNWQGKVTQDSFLVAEIDPQFMGGMALCEHYGIAPEQGANCVIVEGSRGEKRTLAACLIPVSCQRADFNGVIRKQLNARRVSLAQIDEVLQQTAMEYGSITVVGLPSEWPVFVDATLVNAKQLIIGAGLQKSKLSLPGKALLELPNMQLIDGLCR